jgi:F-type H+-transporting ATPase subunit delta
MKLDLIAARYAEAFLEYTKETIGLQQAVGEFKALKRAILDNPEFLLIMNSTFISAADKYSFLDDICKGRFCDEVSAFLKLIIEKNRTHFLMDIIRSFLDSCAQGEEKEVMIKSAFPLEGQELETIKEKIENSFGKDLHFVTKVDKGLLGGVRVEVGSTVIDGSLRGGIVELKEEIKTRRTRIT